MLHMAALSQIRLNTQGRAYYRRKRVAGKTHLEAMRCLKRRISDAVYRQLLHDAAEDAAALAPGAGPEGQSGASQESSAAGLPSHNDTSDQPLPDPPTRGYAPRPHSRQERPTNALQSAS